MSSNIRQVSVYCTGVWVKMINFDRMVVLAHDFQICTLSQRLCLDAKSQRLCLDAKSLQKVKLKSTIALFVCMW